MNTSGKEWIFASKHESSYIPEEIINNLDDFYAGLEYGDVVQNEYQLWEYPTGTIFNIEADRELGEDENHYATPYGNKGTIWLPKLTEISVDKDRVAQAYASLKS